MVHHKFHKTLSVALNTTNSTKTEIELNPGLSYEKKTTNCLKRDTALCVLLTINGILKSNLENFSVGMYNFIPHHLLHIFKYSSLLLLFIYLFVYEFCFIDR
jgi:hypothetical protein